MTNGYFKVENSTERRYEAPIIDLSASGLLFAHTSADLAKELLVHTDLELTVRLDTRHRLPVGGRIMRKFRDAESAYFGLLFLRIDGGGFQAPLPLPLRKGVRPEPRRPVGRRRAASPAGHELTCRKRRKNPGAAQGLSSVPAGCLAGPSQDALRRVISRSIAVGSGKGGVGKTITACNLAIFYARKGLRVGLVDLDPLSDVASLLDLYESEQARSRRPRQEGLGGHATASPLDGNVMPVFKRLEILFPYQKLTSGEAQGVMEKIYNACLAEIDQRYDVLIFDMPAGLGLDDNLAYLPFMKLLVLVTNPEPTAHASAGAYAKEVQRLFPGTIHPGVAQPLFSREVKEGFHPSDVAGNYNRFVDPEDRLTPEESGLLRDFAFVPEDPALDLLQGEPSPVLHILKCMKDGIDYAHGQLLSQATRKLGPAAEDPARGHRLRSSQPADRRGRRPTSPAWRST